MKAITAHPTKSTHLSLFAVKPYPRPLLAKLFGEEGIIGRRRLLVSVPFAVATVQARLFELLPSPPLTTSQVDLLRMDNIVSEVLPGCRELGIEPIGVEEVVPTYISRSHVLEPH